MITLWKSGMVRNECCTAEDILALEPGIYEYQTDGGNCLITIEISK